MLQISHLNRYFGPKQAVCNLSFSVSPGEVVGFIGPNGAGKSTTMRMIAGGLLPSSGTIRVNGFDLVTQPDSAKQALGFLPDSTPVYAGMSVADFITYPARLRGRSAREIRAEYAAWVEACCIESVLKQNVETLSKGYRHRVCLAQVLLCNPQLLILDEPTDGLDPNQKQHVRALIRQMGDAGKTVILSTHILEEVMAVCPRVIMIADGVKCFDGAASDFAPDDSISAWEARFKTLSGDVL